jgi:hypothetical protein
MSFSLRPRTIRCSASMSRSLSLKSQGVVLQTGNLLWRLRRAHIETGMLQIQSEILRQAKQAQCAD